MPELRKDPIIDRWVIIASERGRRPSDFKVEEESSDKSGFCPFCYGNESKTPPEIYAVRPEGSAANTPGWLVRVVPNRYPALAIEGNLDRRGLGMFDMMNGVGAHEVIIETPEHQMNLCEAPQEQLERILTAYRCRLVDLRRDLRFRYMLVFRNYGKVAGATLSHPHSQLIALAITPRIVKEELMHGQAHYRSKERCIFCDLISQEQALGKRIIFQNEHFIALSPFASRFPFEVHLFPLRHSHDFTEMTREEEMALARSLKDILRRLKEVLENPPYNYILHTAPALHPRPGHPEYWGTIALDYHWHIEIVPRLTEVAGFEWGTGFYINPVAPEEATLFLRDAG
jgi:UDPglucose--hexose-1-phosphate uridylyltransferase